MYDEIDPNIEYVAVDRLLLEELIGIRVEKLLITFFTERPSFLAAFIASLKEQRNYFTNLFKEG